MSELKNKIKYFIEQNDIKSLEKILKNESNLSNIKQHKYFDPIVSAIKQQRVNLIQFFHSKGFQINVNTKSLSSKQPKKRKHDSESPKKCEISFAYSNCLIEAIKCLNIDAVKTLIELNVNLNSTDYKHIPLQIAYNIHRAAKKDLKTRQDSFEILRLMLQNSSINPNIYNNEGHRLIHQVVLDKNIEVLQLLINSPNLKINVLTYNKMQNSLHLVSEKRKSDTKESLNDDKDITIKISKMLIDAGCNLDHKDLQLHETPIFKAVMLNDYNLVKLFVTEGINLSIRNVFGNDALSRSIQLGRYKIARLLIDVDSPIRKSTCFYKMPKTISEQRHLNTPQYDNERVYQQSFQPNENSLIDSLTRYEEFLKYLRIHTQEMPRSLKDIARLAVRSHLKRPISSHIGLLALPQCINDLLLLKDID